MTFYLEVINANWIQRKMGCFLWSFVTCRTACVIYTIFDFPARFEILNYILCSREDNEDALTHKRFIVFYSHVGEILWWNMTAIKNMAKGYLKIKASSQTEIRPAHPYWLFHNSCGYFVHGMVSVSRNEPILDWDSK